jgi:hypothetical protein
MGRGEIRIKNFSDRSRKIPGNNELRTSRSSWSGQNIISKGLSGKISVFLQLPPGYSFKDEKDRIIPWHWARGFCVSLVQIAWKGCDG